MDINLNIKHDGVYSTLDIVFDLEAGEASFIMGDPAAISVIAPDGQVILNEGYAAISDEEYAEHLQNVADANAAANAEFEAMLAAMNRVPAIEGEKERRALLASPILARLRDTAICIQAITTKGADTSTWTKAQKASNDRLLALTVYDAALEVAATELKGLPTLPDDYAADSRWPVAI